MAKLAAWSIDRQHDESAPQQPKPKRIRRSQIGLEKYLEDWITNDITLIGEGLTLVGRQVTIDDGRLDLLAVDSQDRWVVIEVKPGMLDAGALTQALYYASSIARLDADELREKLEPSLGDFGDAEQLLERLNRQSDGEEEGREIAVLLVGAGIHPGLERMSGFLGGFGVPISIVSFEVFELDDGPQLLIREVVDEPTAPTAPLPPKRKFTVEAIRQRAVDEGVGTQFDRFVEIAEAAGLHVRPHKLSVSIAPLSKRNHFLMFAHPLAGGSSGELYFEVYPNRFAEFFPDIDEQEVADTLGEWHEAYVGGEALDTLLDGIEGFLTDKTRQLDTRKG